MMSYKFKTVVLALVAFFLLSGCKKVDLHHNLDEIEVDEILVLLQDNGIEAEKVKEMVGQEVTWKISVKQADESRARQILIANNLPRKKELGLSGVYKEKGLIPTPDEQKARYLLALKGEIINSLHKIPGVVDVDVVLNVPQENEFSQLDPVKQHPTASIVVRTRNEELVSQTVTESKIQRFVANTVPNLDPNDVTVIISRSFGSGASPVLVGQTPSSVVSPLPEGTSPDTSSFVNLAGLRLDPVSAGRFKLYMVGLLSLLLSVSGFLLFNIMRLNRLRLRLQRGHRAVRASLPTGEGMPALEGGQAQEGVEGTFNVGAEEIK